MRSVHSLLSFRFGGDSSYLTVIHPSLHCVQFISPTSAPHIIGGLVAPFHNPRSHSITLSGSNPPTNQSSHKQPVKLHFIPQRLFHYTPNPPMLFSNAFPMVYFLLLRRVSPIKTPKGRAASSLHLNGELFRRTAKIRATIRPHHPLVVQ